MVDLAILVALLVGIFQPGGAGTTIRLHDDNDPTNHAAGTPHTFAEIAASPFAADFAALGTNEPSYRGLVSVQIGDPTINSNVTTLTDTNKTVIFDNTRTLTFGGAPVSSWFLNLGTKVGTGNQASGKDGCTIVVSAATVWSSNVALYGCTIKTRAGAFTLGSLAGVTNELINCIFQSSVAAPAAPFSFGAATIPIDNMYNVDFSHSTANQIFANFIATTAERITMSGASPNVILQVGAPLLLAKDLVLFGDPVTSDLRWQAAGATNWKLLRPTFTGLAPKFSIQSPGNPSLASGATLEYWPFDLQTIDRNGNGVANIPVKVTDATGEVQLDVLTDPDGHLTFGSGTTQGFMVVMDHYAVGSAYTQRHRSPFYSEVNTGINRNPNYLSRRFYWYWPGYLTITTSSGQFEDMHDVVPIEEQSGGGTNWVELTL